MPFVNLLKYFSFDLKLSNTTIFEKAIDGKKEFEYLTDFLT
jgi:hypothetical protein